MRISSTGAIAGGLRALRSAASSAYASRLSGAIDPRDVVALYPLNNDNFPVSLAMDNYQGVRNQTDEI